MIEYTREDVIEALEYLLSPVCTETQFDYCDEIRAAIALLKAQEPRVMTPREFDEVRLSKPIWLEVRNMGLLGPALSRYLRPEYGKVAFSLIENRAIERDVTAYNWGWRCWTYRPSPEQMRETKWEEAGRETRNTIGDGK